MFGATWRLGVGGVWGRGAVVMRGELPVRAPAVLKSQGHMKLAPRGTRRGAVRGDVPRLHGDFRGGDDAEIAPSR